jgi:hypothetical protein
MQATFLRFRKKLKIKVVINGGKTKYQCSQHFLIFRKQFKINVATLFTFSKKSKISVVNNFFSRNVINQCTVKPVHNGLCPQRKPVINGHFVKNTSFFMVFVWN